MRTVDPERWPVRVGRTRLVAAPPGPGLREARLRASVADAVGEFWQRGPISGHTYVKEAANNKLRGVYICLLLCAVVCGVAVSVAVEHALAGRVPTATTRLAGGRQLRRLDFPAVALCATNLVSRAALRDYARKLSELDGNRTYARQELERHLTAFGALSEMVGAPADLDVRFASFLATLGHRNVSDIAYRLAPRCSELLVRCTWRARAMPCERLFAARATPHGYCCTFNARYQ
ncbi:PREDICTED: sodium channel protein Nach-like [Papilio xuthus]|uniref:Sodium channel protein Nach-like n=1 Tax=Papilio xuthus TaxID=66420 RepID=A0AAJ7EBD3_PAPXU|nr:PREDICTED: sodium channel protein Nach-like [Papilio xuthus]